MPENVPDHIIHGMLEMLVEQGKGHPVELTINNQAGQPFEVITEPGGKVAWGVGGGKGARPQLAGDPEMTKAVRSTIAKSAGQAIHVTVENHAGRPFEVITNPGGKVAWGVGGSGKAVGPGDKVRGPQ
jgi:hypothetical protein